MLSDMSSWGMFLIGVASLALPAVLALAAKALFGWRYGNTVERHMNQRGSGLSNDAVVASTQEESGPARQSLTLRQVEAPTPSASIADDHRAKRYKPPSECDGHSPWLAASRWHRPRW
jgi:hypothetical protein